jgi:hypothetical protein
MSEQYNKAWEKFLEEQDEEEPDLEVEFGAAWKACKQEVLKIIGEPTKYTCSYVEEIKSEIEKL